MHKIKQYSRLLNALSLCVVLALLSACGSAPKVSSAPTPAPRAAMPATTAPVAGQAAPNLPKAGSGRGGYYKDDGPGDNPPPGLELTLDAEPKVEPYSKSGNKPYVVFGKTYVPLIDDTPFSQTGTGSWYGKKFHGQKTSSGEPYDMYKMTAAHPTLPIPSYARITNLSNGKQVIVKINDRGPFHTNRIVDLSYTAALKLDYLGKGSSELLLERLLPADIEKMAENKKNRVTETVAAASPSASPSTSVQSSAPISAPPALTVTALPATAAASTVGSTAVGGVSAVKPDTAAFENLVASNSAAPVNPPPNMSAPVVSAAVTSASVPPVINSPNPASGFYLQFGAFGLRSNAEATFTRLQETLKQLPSFEIVQQGTLYRLFSGPFVSRDEANRAIQLALSAGVSKPVIVQR